MMWFSFRNVVIAMIEPYTTVYYYTCNHYILRSGENMTQPYLLAIEMYSSSKWKCEQTIENWNSLNLVLVGHSHSSSIQTPNYPVFVHCVHHSHSHSPPLPRRKLPQIDIFNIFPTHWGQAMPQSDMFNDANRIEISITCKYSPNHIVRVTNGKRSTFTLSVFDVPWFLIDILFTMCEWIFNIINFRLWCKSNLCFESISISSSASNRIEFGAKSNVPQPSVTKEFPFLFWICIIIVIFLSLDSSKWYGLCNTNISNIRFDCYTPWKSATLRNGWIVGKTTTKFIRALHKQIYGWIEAPIFRYFAFKNFNHFHFQQQLCSPVHKYRVICKHLFRIFQRRWTNEKQKLQRYQNQSLITKPVCSLFGSHNSHSFSLFGIRSERALRLLSIY